MEEVQQGSESPVSEYSHFFEVRLDLFDGPIDLLLHLVKLNELPIEKLSLAQVATQYLHCIEQHQGKFDLEIAGEYLVIAATLLAIKSSYLLREPIDLEVPEDGGDLDPYNELLRRLREAEIFKQGAEMLNALEHLERDVFSPQSTFPEAGEAPVLLRPADPILLVRAFRSLLDKTGAELYTVTLESISVVGRMMEILEMLKSSREPIVFYNLIPDRSSRAGIVATFCALLELCKRQIIGIRQEGDSEEISIVLVTADLGEIHHDLGELRHDGSDFDAGEDRVANS